MMKDIIVVLADIRSLHNVGSILRTCDGFGVKRLLACGLTPYPKIKNDPRLPHIAERAQRQIAKTALGAEQTVAVEHFESLDAAVAQLKKEGVAVWAIEQDKNSTNINAVKADSPTAIVLGNEISGVDLKVAFDKIVEIPMRGRKESFNVSVTAGIVIYHLTQN